MAHHRRTHYRPFDSQGREDSSWTPYEDGRRQELHRFHSGDQDSRRLVPEHWNEKGDDRSDRRSWWNRAGDEVLSWFGDDYAERRRRHDDPGHHGKGPRNYKRPDERIREDINDSLTDEWNVDAQDIEVAVTEGEVILTGYVADRFQKRRAEEVAERVRGVKHVENRIRVQTYNDKDNVNLIP